MSDRLSCVRPTGQGRGKQLLNNCYCARAPPETFKRDSWAAPQPSPALPSPALPSPRRRQAQVLARGERLRQEPRTMAKFCQVDGSRTRLVWLVGGQVWRAWDASLQAQHWSGFAAHRRPHPGLYRPNNTRTVVRTHCKGISIQSIFTFKRTSRLPAVTHISCHGSAGSKALAWALCITSGHAARPKDTSATFWQPLGRTPALQVTGLHNH